MLDEIHKETEETKKGSEKLIDTLKAGALRMSMSCSRAHLSPAPHHSLFPRSPHQLLVAGLCRPLPCGARSLNAAAHYPCARNFVPLRPCA